jgi:iron(III) transport system permease protein
VCVALFLVLLVALPIGWVLVTSLRTAQASATFANYATAFTDRDLLQPILLTLGVGLGVGTLSALVGAAMGWLVARTDLPSRRLIKNLVRAPSVGRCWPGQMLE